MSTTKKIATFVRNLEGFQGEARLYVLSVAVPFWKEMSGPVLYTTFVAVSAANTWDHGPETYIFPTDRNGKVLSWTELQGSLRGCLDHERALHLAGYILESPANSPNFN